MQLLVSVRDPGEAARALAGGAGIIDAKEPTAGALGAVAPDVLLDIAHMLPANTPLSAALGEGGGDRLLAAIRSTPVLPGRRPWFMKFALDTPAGDGVRAALDQARNLRLARRDAPRLILARFADQGLDDMAAWLDTAAQGGAWGVLLDTASKDGQSLFDLVDLAALRGAASSAHQRGLHFAVAGSLALQHLELALEIGADIVGVRRAACDGGRTGMLTAARVQELRARLGQLSGPRAPGVLLASPS